MYREAVKGGGGGEERVESQHQYRLLTFDWGGQSESFQMDELNYLYKRGGKWTSMSGVAVYDSGDIFPCVFTF